MNHAPELISAKSFHGRRGGIRNAFTYSVDYLLIDLENPQVPALLSRNGFNLFSVNDRQHGGTRGAGQALVWARSVFADWGFDQNEGQSILLLAQPSFLGFHFNPVSFWFLLQDGALHAVIAEVNNTFGHRHSYVCARADHGAIGPREALKAEKVFHVSPFQAVQGSYTFHFDISDTAISIRIQLSDGTEGVLATLQGPRQPATNGRLIWSALRRPFGALRVIGLIYWQALKLKLKGASYAPAPAPPTEEVS